MQTATYWRQLQRGKTLFIAANYLVYQNKLLGSRSVAARRTPCLPRPSFSLLATFTIFLNNIAEVELYRAIFSNKRISFPLSYPFLYNYYNTPQLKFILGYLDITSRLSFGWIMVHRIFT